MTELFAVFQLKRYWNLYVCPSSWPDPLLLFLWVSGPLQSVQVCRTTLRNSLSETEIFPFSNLSCIGVKCVSWKIKKKKRGNVPKLFPIRKYMKITKVRGWQRKEGTKKKEKGQDRNWKGIKQFEEEGWDPAEPKNLRRQFLWVLSNKI